MKKKLTALLLAAACCAGTVVAACACEEQKPEHLGLYVAEDGTMMKDGEAYYGVGINYYSMMSDCTKKNKAKYDVTQAIETLELFAEYDVEVVRFNLGYYNATEWYNFISKNMEQKHLEALDKIVEKAEELGIGLMPAFAWNPPAISDAFNEPCNRAYASYDTKTMEWFLGFTKRVVTRYAESPAIYGWEFGNELNLNSSIPAGNRPKLDPPPQFGEDSRPARTEEDYMTFTTLNKAFTMFAETVYNADPYHRIIGSGDAGQRTCAWKWHKGESGTDTAEEFSKIIDLANPEHMTAISTHEYASKNAGKGGLAFDALPVADNCIHASNYTEYLQGYLKEAKRTKKTAYLGETGYLPTSGSATEAHCVQVIEAILGAALDTDFPLVMLWNYDPNAAYDPEDHTKFTGGTDVSWNVQFVKGRGYMEAIKEYNRLMAEKHAQDVTE